MERPARLQAARGWLEKYRGKNVISGYRKHFGIDWFCAFIELEMLGIEVDADYKSRALKSVQEQAAARERRKTSPEMTTGAASGIFGQDEHFAFIVGYTSGGFPYGLMWEKWEEFDEEDEI